MTDTPITAGALSRPAALRQGLAWMGALLVATFGLTAAMSLPAAAQPATVDLGNEGQASRTVVVPLGKSAVIELPRPAADILVSDPAVIDTVVRTPRRVFVTGTQQGATNAFFFDSRGEPILQLTVRVEQDWEALQSLIARLVPGSRVSVETVGQNVVLTGAVDSAVDSARAFEIANRFVQTQRDVAPIPAAPQAPPPVMNLIEVREPGQVMLKVRVVEMQRSLVRQLGVDVNGVARIDDDLLGFSIDTAGPTSGGLSADLGLTGLENFSRLDYALDVFEQNALLRTLAEPSLVAQSGAEASFFAGGEVAFPVAGALGVTEVQFREFGVQLGFTPTVRSRGSIQVALETTVSDVNRALGAVVGGGLVEDPETGEFERVGTFSVPGFSRRSATTTVDLPSGASFAIAGLLQDDIQELIDGVPGAKEIPVLGQLFRSQAFERQETELVIIATPYLVEPSSLAELTDPSDGFAAPGALEQVLLGRLETAFGVRAAGVGEAGLSGPVGFVLD